jgi:hypothetical protein
LTLNNMAALLDFDRKGLLASRNSYGFSSSADGGAASAQRISNGNASPLL